MAKPQLQLIANSHTSRDARAHEEATPAQRVFRHGREVWGKPPYRCRERPEVLRVIEHWLGEYDEAVLCMAAEGLAADAWAAEHNRCDWEFLLRTATSIERHAERGERMRAMLAAEDTEAAQRRQAREERRAEVEAAPVAASPNAQRCRELAARLRQQSRGR